MNQEMHKEITFNEFIKSSSQNDEMVALFIYSNTSSRVFPPPGIIIADPSPFEFYDLSSSKLMKYPNLEELHFDLAFIDALPNDISKLASLRRLSLMFSHRVNLKNELNKLKGITSLETLRVISSLLNEGQFNLLKDSLDGVKVYY